MPRPGAPHSGEARLPRWNAKAMPRERTEVSAHGEHGGRDGRVAPVRACPFRRTQIEKPDSSLTRADSKRRVTGSRIHPICGRSRAWNDEIVREMRDSDVTLPPFDSRHHRITHQPFFGGFGVVVVGGQGTCMMSRWGLPSVSTPPVS